MSIQAARPAIRTRQVLACDPRKYLNAIKTATNGQENILYPLRDALREVWGVYQPQES
jgi:hypothetical protein